MPRKATFNITHYDFDLNPRFGAKGEKRWIVRMWGAQALDGVTGHAWVALISYANKATARGRAAKENAALKASQASAPLSA